MFDNYSIADLFANIYKKWLVNLIAVIAIFCVVALPYTYKTLGSKVEINNTPNYSSYIIYKITSPQEEQQNLNRNMVGGYTDFYSKLISSNLTGAFLFNDLSENDMKKVASELGASEVMLKNSNLDYWEKKIEVNALANNAGVTVKVLTPSKFTNDIIENKLDGIVTQYKDVYQNVSIDKLETVNSQEIVGETTAVGISKMSLLIRLVLLGVGALIITLLGNIIFYIFNPTINRAGDYSRYGIAFITNITSPEGFNDLIRYKNGNSSLLLIGTNKKVIDTFSKEYSIVLSKNVAIGDINNVKTLIEADSILFIEEYGVTRYKNFEENLQVVKNLNKKILGVATYKL